MVKYNERDLIPLQEFPFSWRITDERWDKLPAEILGELHPLASERCAELSEISRAFQIFGPYGLREDRYSAISRQSLVEDTASDSEKVLRWLSLLPVSDNEDVYVNWATSTNVALITKWRTFKKIWNSLWYPFDAVSIFDETMEWAILLGQEEVAVYSERKMLGIGIQD